MLDRSWKPLKDKPEEIIEIRPVSRISWLVASILMLNGGWLFDSVLLFLCKGPYENTIRVITAILSFALSVLLMTVYSYKSYLSNRFISSSKGLLSPKPYYIHLMSISSYPLALILVFSVIVNRTFPLLHKSAFSTSAPEWLPIVSGIVIFFLLQSVLLSAWFSYMDVVCGRTEPAAMAAVMARSMLTVYKNIGRFIRINVIVLTIAIIVYETQSVIGSILFGFLPPSFGRRLLEELASSFALGIALHISVKVRDWVYASAKNKQCAQDMTLPERSFPKSRTRSFEISVVSLCILAVIVSSAVKYRQDDVISDAIAAMKQDIVDAGSYIDNGNDFFAARASIAEAESIYYSLRGFFASCSPPPDAYGKDTGYYFGMALKDGVKNRYHNLLEIAAMTKRGASRETIYGRLLESRYVTGQLPQMQGLVYTYECSGSAVRFCAETLNSLIYDDNFTFSTKPLISLDLKKARTYGDIDDYYPEMFKIKTLVRLCIIPLQDDIASGLNDVLAQIDASPDKVKEHIVSDSEFCLRIASVLTDCSIESNYDKLIQHYTDNYIENIKGNTAVMPGKLKEAYLTASDLYIGSGSYDKALEIIGECKGIDTEYGDGAVLVIMMRIFNETGRYKESVELFAENVIPGTDDKHGQAYSKACFLNSIALINMSDIEGSIHALQDAIKYSLSAQIADEYIYRFALLYSAKVPAATQDVNPGLAYVKAAGIDGFADLTLCGAVSWKQKDYKAAVGYLEQAAAESDYPGYIHYLLGICYHEMGFLSDRNYLDNAAWHYREAIKLLPSHGYGYFSLAECLKAGGKYDEAVLAFNRCIYLFRTVNHERDPFGLAYHARHSRSEAVNLDKN